MTLRIASTLVAATSFFAILHGVSSHAQESLSTLGNNPAEICASAAADAVSTGNASADGLLACNDAAAHGIMTRKELAATYLNRGVLYMVRGDYPKAIEDDDHALALQGDLTEALLDRGAVFAAERRFGDAVADFTQALSFDPKQPKIVYYNRALAREDLGDLKGAYLDYQKAAELDPSWDKPKHELARFTVAHAGLS